MHLPGKIFFLTHIDYCEANRFRVESFQLLGKIELATSLEVFSGEIIERVRNRVRHGMPLMGH